MNSNFEKASHISYQACNLYDKDSAKIDGSFTMYSHDRFSSLVIKGIAEQMLNDGCTEQQIKECLASKAIRHMLNSEEDTLMAMGKTFVNVHGLSDYAKGMTVKAP